MSFTAKYIPYKQTGAFSKIVTDYLDGSPKLRPFYFATPDADGIKKAIEQRKQYPINRQLLVSELAKEYASVETKKPVEQNIDLLLQENTFTVCTAHQPNIFTGHLYFVYKILHAVKLASALKNEFPGYNFVPVYYMGSEDADLDELGEIVEDGKKYTWNTKQTGAVGRMKIDKPFLQLIAELNGRLLVENHGKEIMALVEACYTEGKTISQSTFEFVHALFGEYGLIVLQPDNAALKKVFIPIVKKELEEQFSNKAVSQTLETFPAEYKVQVAGREINLFYLEADTRERIELTESGYKVNNTKNSFTGQEFFGILETHPERFSANVILRPVFQEMILPNVAFIGGGGELAYWLELKQVFDAVAVPYPVLILRNSFTVVRRQYAAKIRSLGMEPVNFFEPEMKLVEQLVKRESSLQLNLEAEKKSLETIYQQMRSAASAIDPTLGNHTEALMTKALKRIEQLEKKMLRAEKKKFEAQQRQLQAIKASFFPSGTLQERIDNLLPYYATWGSNFIEAIYDASTAMEQEFCFVEER